MKLPTATLSTASKLDEFDVWITPSLGDIRETRQYRNTLTAIVRAFDRLCEATGDFASEAELTHVHLADSLVKLFAGKTRDEVEGTLNDLASALFLITGKSDNNTKCQFPLFLKNDLKRDTLPRGKTTTRKGASTHQVEQVEVPRTLDTDKYMRWVAGLHHWANHQRELIDVFLQFVLNEDQYLAQLWGLGRSYAMLKPLGRSQALLGPLIVFQVRGSVAATGGHEPEKVLRRLMEEWGLAERTDFNSADVNLNKELNFSGEVQLRKKKVKTRAYDFALPYKVAGWEHKVLIQSQFYAGDSGSVSHKNVDQTTAARLQATRKLGAGVRFVEYVDGAGFFASLNGDLKSLLDMPNTTSFLQLRSIPIRLRRELQQVGFLTPIEIEHAVFVAGPDRAAVEAVLTGEGYAVSEITRAIAAGVGLGHLAQADPAHIDIVPARREQARRYFLLDTVAIHGTTLTRAATSLAGYVLVPGYGPFHGMKVAELRKAAVAKAPTLSADWADEQVFHDDLRWLAGRGYVIWGP